MTKMAATPIYGKKNLFFPPEPEDWRPWDLVCWLGLGDVQMMIIGGPWPTYHQGQSCFLLHLNGKKIWEKKKVYF